MILKLKFVLVFIVLIFSIYYINTLNRETLIKNELNEALKVLQTNFDITLNHNTIDVNAMDYLFKRNPKIIDIMSKATTANEEQRAKLRKNSLQLSIYKI
ncbi:hypothetical protein [Sulfurimonas sp.]|uniref:hypothetical protein n=1 Tax=Sulfurimonas sp. TaxID=2022749 RepID=UPI002AB28436|nr:hypothetical protein [Sulfurimonas sp.]